MTLNISPLGECIILSNFYYVLCHISVLLVGFIISKHGLFTNIFFLVRNFIDVRWFGFNDPQSGLAYYVWWAGTSPGGKDVMLEQKIHVTETATALNLTPLMPVGERIYVTVRAVNRAGKNNQSINNIQTMFYSYISILFEK